MSKKLFKKGDRVKSVVGVGVANIVGAIGTVLENQRNSDDEFAVEFDNNIEGHDCSLHGFNVKSRNGWYCTHNKVELLTNSCNSLHITTDGTTTTAVLKDGKNVVKKAVAKCSPDDTFNFQIGAKIAFDRLFGVEPKKEVREVKRKAKVGEWVKIVRAEQAKGNYDNGDIIQIVPSEYGETHYKDKQGCWLLDSEYVVLENYNSTSKAYTQAEVDELLKAEREKIKKEIIKAIEG